MARVKTFVNGGSVLPGDLNSIQDDYENAFGTYKHLLDASSRLDAPAAATYVIVDGTAGAGIQASNAVAGLGVYYYDPADYTANTRTTKLRVRAALLTNATAPTITYTVGLYPVTAVAGAAATVSLTLGAVVAGSTVAFATQALSTLGQANSGDFTAPAAGHYILGVVASGAAAANSSVAVVARLQMRQV